MYGYYYKQCPTVYISINTCHKHKPYYYISLVLYIIAIINNVLIVWDPPGSSVHGDSPGKNTGVGCHTFLQGSLLDCTQIVYCLKHCGSHTYKYVGEFTHTHTHTHIYTYVGFSGEIVVKNQPANAGDAGDSGLIPGLGRSPGGGNSNPLQYSCLENPMDRGACGGATVHGVAKSRTGQSD